MLPPHHTRHRAKGTGGANGTFRLENGKKPNTGANLKNGLAACEKWRAAINARLAANRRVPPGTAVSYADTFQMAGAATVVATGGPQLKALIWDPLAVGRKDATKPDDVAMLPDKNLNFATLACLFREW